MDEEDEHLRLHGAPSDGDRAGDVWMEATGADNTTHGNTGGSATHAESKEATNGADEEEDVSVDEREVLFLIANYLEKRPESRHAAQRLIADLSASDVLGESVSWNGQRKNATYADYKRRHRDLGPDHLLHIIKGALVKKPAQATNASTVSSKSLLQKSRVMIHRKPLTVDERKVMQKEIIDKTIELRKLQRTEAIVKRIVSKYDRLLQFLEDSKVESLPADVREALQTTSSAAVNVTALAADVRAVKQLLQVREEQSSLQTSLFGLLVRARDIGALISTARSSRNHTSLLHRREITMKSAWHLPPTHIYSRIRRLKTLNGHLQIPAYCLTYDKTGKYVITGADDRLIKIWSLHTGDLRFTLRGHVGNITDLAVNQSNTLLASSSDDKTVRVWELSTGAPVAVLLGHTSVVNYVRFHPTKNIVVTASDDGHCFCYKLPDIAKFDEPESKEQTAKRLLDQGAYLLTLRPAFSLSHAQANRPNVRSNKVLCLNFSRCGNFVVTGGQDCLGRVWDVSALSSPEGVSAADFTVGPHEGAPALSPQAAVAPAVEAAPPDAPAGPGFGQPVAVVPNDSIEAPVVTDVEALQFAALPVDAAIALAGSDVPVVQAPQGRQQPQLAEVQQSRQAVVDIEQVTMLSEPIAYLKGHTGPITNILFSHRGDQIATASIKDGTTRVWRWEKKYKKISHKVLQSEEYDRERELARIYGISTRRRPPPAVDTLVWTWNDDCLVTLHSTKPDSGTGEGDWRQRMRIWNPSTGILEKTLAAVDRDKKNGHVNAVFAMDAHPSDWRIVVTAGHDGRIFIWDISEGRILKSFNVTSPEGETVALLDGSFIPTGGGFCFTDRLGRLCIFGTGSGEHLSAAPVQQYFQSDYAALVTDRHFHVIDRETQVAPSLMESGPLMDIFRVQYPVQPPHLLASRGALTVDQYEQNRRRRVQQSLESEQACKVRHSPNDEEEPADDHFPQAILVPEEPLAPVDSNAPLLAMGTYRLNGDAVLQAEIRRMANRNRQRRSQQHRASPTADDRDTSILNVEISSEDDHSDEDFQAPEHRRSQGDEDEEEDDEEDEDEDDDDDLDDDDLLSDASDAPDGDRMRRRRARHSNRRTPGSGRRLGGGDHDEEDVTPGSRLRARRSRARIVGDSDDEVDGEQTLEDGARRQTRGRSRSLSVEMVDSTPDAVVVESNDGFIMNDNQLDRFDSSMTYSEMLQAKQEQAGSNNSGEVALIACAFCGEGDNNGVLKLPGDAMGPHPLVSGTQRLFVHDQCAIASPLCFNRGGRWYNVAKEIRRGRLITCVQCKKRGATVGCTLERCHRSYHWKCAVACGWSLNQIQFYCPEHARRSGAPADSNSSEVQHRLGLSFRREWLQLSSLAGIFPYVPQTGDYVVYFPGPHETFLAGTGLRKPAFLRQVSRFVTIKCQVTEVKYHFPSLTEFHSGSPGLKAIQCEIELAVLAVPTTAFPSTSVHQEEKEEKEETEDTTPDPDTLFDPNAPFFSNFVGVNQFLQPTADSECERLTIKLRYFHNDTSNFIILDHEFEAGVSGNWKVGQRVRMPYVDLDEGHQKSAKTSFGTIEGIRTVYSLANPSVLTPWESVYVRWDADDEDDCYVGPWELKPASQEETVLKRNRDRDLMSVKLSHSRKLSIQQRQNLVDALSSSMELSIAKDFVDPVSSEYADYWVTVANPVDLTKIKERILSGYYRQLDAFVSDVELLHENCETYNVSTSAIAQNSRSLTSSILTNVQQLFPDFFSRRNEGRPRHLLEYPPVTFGSNNDPHDDNDQDSEFEDESRLSTVVSGTETIAEDLPQSEPQPESPLIRQTRSSRTVPEVSDEVASPATSPRSQRVLRGASTAATPERRVKRELATLKSPEQPKGGRKRQRQSQEPRVLKLEDVLSALTSDQRQLFQERASEDLVSLLRDFHEALMGADVYQTFAFPVTEDIAPGYFDIIAQPMDLGTILDNIERYHRFSRYFEDVELVFSNAITYNTWDSEVGVAVKELQGYYVKFLLDAIGASSKTKNKRSGARKTTQLASPSRPATSGGSKRKRKAVSDDDDEDSWGSNESASDEEEDEEDEEEEEDDEGSDDSDDESESDDWSDEDVPRRRRLTRGANKSSAKKSKVKSKKAAKKQKRSSRR